ncbi:hypothetical protein I3760_04G115200 [Carya illinoinensis]|uniref:Late embryogenesis abundant protein LEA-2 subgroup domain-containing protein n=1 Tax=Carya illinoinensis TaxID=32201 RepID=A0A8T1QUK2_CARIL|nr:uncharacterized protein LOC122307821 [Carya illinoinensis]KAG2712247.1 hypothetical protein I3760_04G115200 [Carya illinoinensis]KAG6657814.1 hypothetical protein CIPAW_04G117000 [Carya illinoinensis]KAG6717732.1 hypothetical protein I3842_04G114900 [Carya illinoinensis]
MAAGKTSRGCLKSCCCVTAILLVIIAVVLLALSFTIFRPKDPKITLHVEGLQNIDLSLSMTNVKVNVTLATVITIENQNYGSFKFRNSTAHVHYHGDVVGETPVEERYVPARDKLNMTTYVIFLPGKLLKNRHFLADVGVGSLNLTSTATLPGRMNLLKIFEKHATVYNRCNISIFILTQSVESICHTKLKL